MKKSLTPKLVLIPVARKRDAWLRWVPFSPQWKRTRTFGCHSPTWATALALSAMLFSDGTFDTASVQEEVSPFSMTTPEA